MFFELHEERKIGYKLLSKADLGIGTSHQTHIGLSEYVLTFLSDRDVISEDSIFIYEDSFDYIDAHFDRIETSRGLFRSPKIRYGERNIISVTSTIREKVKSGGEDLKWFLFWFGLKSEKVVFLLFNELSDDYKDIIKLGLNLNAIKKGARVVNDGLTDTIADFIENKVNKNGLNTLKELEEVSQTGTPNKKFGVYDIQKASENFMQIGRAGEELINDFLDAKLQRNEIIHFTWYNKEKESGLPYDFTVENHNGNIIYLDVKATKFDFNQKIIFSSQEIDFISNIEESYNIYRVYTNDDNSLNLRICDDCKDIATKINTFTGEYRRNLLKLNTDLRSAKLAVSPQSEYFKFKSEILLEKKYG